MPGYRPISRINRFFIVLLVLSVVVNGTRAVVLCVGSDGHVAIEMAGHKHCHGSHDDGDDKKQGRHHHNHDSHHHDAVEIAGHHHCEDTHCDHDTAYHHININIEEQNTCCGPHVEIPLSPGITSDLGVEKMPETKVLGTGFALLIPETNPYVADIFVIARAGPASTSYYHPLSKIILIV